MPTSKDQPEPSKKFSIRGLWSSIGPGIVTGAADDDPSGIATYSIAGAQFGLTFLFTALYTMPLMAAVQTMCSRIGMVTGVGLGGALRKKFPRLLLAIVAAILLFANTLNIGADLDGMSDAAQLLTGISSHIWVVLFAVLITFATIRIRYVAFARILRWLALFLALYVIAAIRLAPPWSKVARAVFLPSMPHGSAEWGVVVAVLGTTISPYLFFWQASEEVEEEKAMGRATETQRRGATPLELGRRQIDVGAGAIFSNLAMFFIILTCASALHAKGITNLQSSAQVAAALEPVAGKFSMLLYTLGIIGLGALAIPTLSGSAAYAFAEIFGWKQGMDEPYAGAKAFYAVIAVSIMLGGAMDLAHVNAVKAMFYSAVFNGLLAPVILVGVLLVASDSKLMQGQPSSVLNRVVVGLTTLLMILAAVALFVL
jgi:NRAMP (natural resistance-associated macrophage protein)-like metal ion transporter